MRKTQLLVLAAVIAASTAVAPSSASAAMTLTRTTGTTGPSASDTKTAIATCPSGTRVIGGGGDINGGSGSVHLTGLQPNGLTNTFYALAAEHYATNVAWTLIAYAVCAPAPAGLEYVYEVTPTAQSFTSQSDYAFCTPGKKVLGSGARVTSYDTSLLFLTYSKPTGTGNGAEAGAVEKTGGFGGDWQLHTWAVCADEPAGWQVLVDPSDNQGTVAGFVCPGTKKLAGAGAIITLSLGRVYLTDTLVTVQLANPTVPKSTTIYAGIVASGADHDWIVKAHAICVS